MRIKTIISQDKHQVFTCGQCQVYNISHIEMPSSENGKIKILYSVGVAGISLGQFTEEARALEALMEIAAFLGNEKPHYTVPKNKNMQMVTKAYEKRKKR